MRSAIALLLGLVTLWGCAPQYTLQKPERVAIGTHYSVDTPIAWSRLVDGKTELWTVNGSGLEALALFSGIEDGETLFKVSDQARAQTPKFKKGMTALDARDFIDASMVRSGAQNLTIRDFRAAPFGSLPGFRAELEFQNKSGLEKAGFLVGAIHNDRLHLIIYTAARLHFFEKYKNDAEKIAASVMVKS